MARGNELSYLEKNKLDNITTFNSPEALAKSGLTTADNNWFGARDSYALGDNGQVIKNDGWGMDAANLGFGAANTYMKWSAGQDAKEQADKMMELQEFDLFNKWAMSDAQWKEHQNRQSKQALSRRNYNDSNGEVTRLTPEEEARFTAASGTIQDQFGNVIESPISPAPGTASASSSAFNTNRAPAATSTANNTALAASTPVPARSKTIRTSAGLSNANTKPMPGDKNKKIA